MSTDLYEGEHVSVTRFFAGSVHGVAYQVTSARELNPGTERYCHLTSEGMRELLSALLVLLPHFVDAVPAERSER